MKISHESGTNDTTRSQAVAEIADCLTLQHLLQCKAVGSCKCSNAALLSSSLIVHAAL